MKIGVVIKGIYCIFVNCLVLIPLNVNAQEMIRPIQRTILLSGNFGELRATHFHSGIDIRTGGVEGLPVVCVKEGRLARVRVSPVGYGQALYVEHADGTTTVYGHLQRFIPRIASVVRELQYQNESFELDADVTSQNLHFKQGDTIAFSGNSGSSGGPHLHFEVRDTRTECTLNPLLYYKIADQKPPVVKSVYLYTRTENGCVDLYRQGNVKALGNGRYNGGMYTIPAGKVGVAVYAIDYMNDSWNKLGIYKMQLFTSRDTLFSMSVDTCTFGQPCYINEMKDFERYKRQETVYRCFGHFQNEIPGVQNRRGGWIEVAKDSTVVVSIQLQDINGNISRLNFSLKGGTPKSDTVSESDLLRYDRAYHLKFAGGHLELDSAALLTSVKKAQRVEKDTVNGRDIFVLSEKDIPLLRKGRLFLEGKYEKNALICELGSDGRRFPVATHWQDTGLAADIAYLNRYTVVQDSLPPTILYLGRFPDRTLRFRIKDEFSGITSFRGEVNGQWCLFSYDPRVNLMQCSMAEPVFKPGNNVVRVIVEDRAGNKNEVVVNVK